MASTDSAAWAQHPVMTVAGAVAAGELGITLPHEHVLCDASKFVPQMPAGSTEAALADAPVTIERLEDIGRYLGRNRDTYKRTDVATAAAETKLFHDLGGRTIVDITTDDICRDVEGLATIAQITTTERME